MQRKTFVFINVGEKNKTNKTKSASEGRVGHLQKRNPSLGLSRKTALKTELAAVLNTANKKKNTGL